MATPKLYLDEDVSPRVAEALRQQGFDVLHVSEVGRIGEPDEAQLLRKLVGFLQENEAKALRNQLRYL